MVSNSSSPLSSGCAHLNLESVDVAVSSLFFLMFPVALFLNGVATWVSLHLQSTSTFIVYLKNLLAADLLVTLTLPPMAASMLPGASVEIRVLACRYSDVIFYSCLYTSIALMGLISQDRFFKIVRPCGKVLGQSLPFSVVTSSLVWVVLFGGTVIPTMILTDRGSGNVTGDFCMSLKSPAGVTLHKYVVFSMEILFWFVSVLITSCYICITLKVLQSFRNSGSSNSHGKKKIQLRVFLILLVFFVCFMPLHIMRIPFTIRELSHSNACDQMWMLILHKIVLWVSTTNACLDPLLYIYLCREYKDKLVDLMKARVICVGLHSGTRETTSQ